MRFTVSFVSIFFSLLFTSPASSADWESAKRAYQQKDYAAALKEVVPLAEQGNSDAQVLLGRMYLRGRGVLQSPGQALEWFKAAAAQGNTDGEFLLGSMYLLPRSNTAEGLKWVRLAASHGNKDAQLLLGKTCLEGLPELPRDPVQADMWLRLAAKDNLPFYGAELASAEKQMSPDQIAKGKALADVWKPVAPGKSDEKPAAADKL